MHAQVSELSFVQVTPAGSFDTWAPPPLEADYDAACIVGRGLAIEAADYMEASGDMTLLGSIVRRISEKGQFGGVEAGFFAALPGALA